MFVHGTGVRQPAYDATFELIGRKIGKIRSEYLPARCYWGGLYGARLNAGGISIPPGRSDRSAGADVAVTAGGNELTESADDNEIALWELLERDPLFELRLLSVGDRGPDELAPNAEPPGHQLASQARQLAASPSVAALAAGAGLDRVLPQSVEAILGSPVTLDALRREHVLGGEIRAVLSRAAVADAIRRADASFGGELPLDGEHRDALLAAMVAELGGTDRGIGSALARMALSTALTLGASRPVERRRAAITAAAAPASGDVLMYLARGGAIRDHIAATVAGINDEVVLLAHSLGGIASLETLATQRLPNVALLVTFGSQAPFLYELNALPVLAYGGELPDAVPPWVNVFDRRDLLAFAGSGVFPGRVTDYEVDCRTPFPRSHSAYVAHDGFYSILDGVMP